MEGIYIYIYIFSAQNLKALTFLIESDDIGTKFYY